MAKEQKKQPPPKPRPKPKPPIQPQPGDILRDRRRLSTPLSEEKGLGLKENTMDYNRKKGLGFSAGAFGTKMKPGNARLDPDPRMPYTPGTGTTKTLPYTPGTGTTKTMPYRPKPKMKPLSYDNEPMDMGWPSEEPPHYATMEYNPVRDGSASEPLPPYEGDGVGAENLGKQEENRKWKYDNWRSEQGDPIPEDQANIYNDLFDEWDRKRPVTGSNENPGEMAQWESNVRSAAEAAGLSPEEIERLLDDLYRDYQ